jgi:hypothetical protein
VLFISNQSLSQPWKRACRLYSVRYSNFYSFPVFQIPLVFNQTLLHNHAFQFDCNIKIYFELQVSVGTSLLSRGNGAISRACCKPFARNFRAGLAGAFLDGCRPIAYSVAM